MSPDLAFDATLAAENAHSIERRSHQRYPVAVEIRYKLSDGRGLVVEGLGKTRDLSTGGILFSTGKLQRRGLKAELTMAWPLRAAGKSPLRLEMRGKVVRSGPDGLAVQISRYEFRNALPAALPSASVVADPRKARRRRAS